MLDKILEELSRDIGSNIQKINAEEYMFYIFNSRYSDYYSGTVTEQIELTLRFLEYYFMNKNYYEFRKVMSELKQQMAEVIQADPATTEESLFVSQMNLSRFHVLSAYDDNEDFINSDNIKVCQSSEHIKSFLAQLEKGLAIAKSAYNNKPAELLNDYFWTLTIQTEALILLANNHKLNPNRTHNVINSEILNHQIDELITLMQDKSLCTYYSMMGYDVLGQYYDHLEDYELSTHCFENGAKLVKKDAALSKEWSAYFAGKINDAYFFILQAEFPSTIRFSPNGHKQMAAQIPIVTGELYDNALCQNLVRRP